MYIYIYVIIIFFIIFFFGGGLRIRLESRPLRGKRWQTGGIERAVDKERELKSVGEKFRRQSFSWNVSFKCLLNQDKDVFDFVAQLITTAVCIETYRVNIWKES